MAYPKPSDDVEEELNEIQKLIKIATNPSTQREFKNIKKLCDRDVVGVFLKEKKFKPYRRKPVHLVLIYKEYKRWCKDDKLMSLKDFKQHLSWYYKPVDKDGETYYYTRFSGLQNRKSLIKRYKNELKKKKTSRQTEEE